MSIIFLLASLFFAVVPMVAYLLILWWLDRNEREPLWVMILNFAWGATGAIILGIIGSLIFQIPLSALISAAADGDAREITNLSGAIITAPVVEEFTKGVFLLIMATTKNFDGVVDGVVYGGAIGLGFGMTENFLYFTSTGENWITIVIIRTLFSAVMHALAQGTFGGIVGYAKFKSAGVRFLLIPIGYVSAVLLHVTWNFSVSFEDTTVLGLLFMLLYGAAFFSIFQIALFMEGKTIMKELQEEVSLGLIPAEHLRFIPYVSRRSKPGWCPYGVNQKDYIKTAVELAIRKHQYKHISGNKKMGYYNDVENLRHKIKSMFFYANKLYHETNWRK